jgi:hypothetical protein
MVGGGGRSTRVCHEAREMGLAVLDIDRVRSTRHPSLPSLYTSSLVPRPPITLSCPAVLLFTELVALSTYCTSTIFPFVIGRTCRHHFFFSLTSPLYSSRYVHSRTQAGPTTPSSPSYLRTHPFSCPAISPPDSSPITSPIRSYTSLSHAPKSVDGATARLVGSSQPRTMG